jgi:hypothetical protein
MKPQVTPEKCKIDLSILDRHFRFKSKFEKILYKVSLISKFIPHISHAIDVIHGSQGTSKSTTLRKFKEIVDPSEFPLLKLTSKVDDVAIQLSGHTQYYICYDNISTISEEISNLLCMAATGGAYPKRKLFKDTEEIILKLFRPVSLNGINVVATKPDLLDRALLLELQPINPEERKTDQELWDSFNQDKPQILGMIFTILSKAMQIVPTLKLRTLGRMADFTLWGYAIAEAAGLGGDAFLKAYLNNQNHANTEAIEANPIASAIMRFMEKRYRWQGTARELLNSLIFLAVEGNYDTKSFLWASTPNVLSRRLNEIKTNLAQAGLIVTIDKKNRRIDIDNTNLKKEPVKSSKKPK